MKSFKLIIVFFIFGLNFHAFSPQAKAATLLEETFDDSNFASRGWYDHPSTPISTAEHIPGSKASARYHWAPGATTPDNGSAMRHKFTPSNSVYVSYWVKYSANYIGSGQTYHPHEFYILTTIDPDFSGLAFTHLTAYIEQNFGSQGGVPRLALTDGANIIQNKINVNLVGVTENRAINGCNGNKDVYPGGCYNAGPFFNNDRLFDATSAYFSNSSGANYKNNWHFVEAYFQLNTIVNGVGQADGLMQYWYDGSLVINVPNVALRTGQYPNMQFNQFIMAPFIGDGSPADQSFWVDNLTIATSRPSSTPPSPPQNLKVQ
jgi:hypothetical protein